MKKCSFLILLPIFLTACHTTLPDEDKVSSPQHITSSDSSTSSGIDSYVPGSMGSATPAPPPIQATNQKDLLNMIANEDIAFTDPDNPLADIKEIDDAFEGKKLAKLSWTQSYGEALKEARRSGKPILIWFHDSKFSPPSKLLGTELLSTKEFISWCKDRLILICYDKTAQYSNEKRQDANGKIIDAWAIAEKKQNYIKKAFEHFNVKGAPCIAILAPDGEQIDSWNGYSTGTSKLIFDKIKNSTNLGLDHFDEIKKKFTQLGFRTWAGSNGIEVFAILTRYNEKTSDVWLKEFDGHQIKTKIQKLNKIDQDWIQKEKTKREKAL
ncbi:MAG: hypothetical protein RR373_07955 [Akkermansia sp.]